MDLTEAGEGGAETYGRNAAFGQGSSGNPYRVASSMNGTAYSDKVGQGFTPQSVLQQTVASSNGYSSGDYARMLSNGSLLPDSNGMDSKTSTGIDRLLLDGMRQVGTL